jgi:hypothetical protein
MKMLFFINSLILMLLTFSGTTAESRDINLALLEDLPIQKNPFDGKKNRYSGNSDKTEDNSQKLKQLSVFGLSNSYERLSFYLLSIEQNLIYKNYPISEPVYRTNLPRSPPLHS